jgi:hypothetical protein
VVRDELVSVCRDANAWITRGCGHKSLSSKAVVLFRTVIQVPNADLRMGGIPTAGIRGADPNLCVTVCGANGP